MKTTYLSLAIIAVMLLGGIAYHQQQIAKEQSRAAELLEVQRKQKLFKDQGEAAAAKYQQEQLDKMRAQQQRRY